jgi:hypothetical protein
MEEINQATTVEGIIAESIQSPNTQTKGNESIQIPITQKEKPEGVQITALQTKENESIQNPITPIIIRSAIGWTPRKPVELVQVPVDLRDVSKNYA